jgi:hypothetical protein
MLVVCVVAAYLAAARGAVDLCLAGTIQVFKLTDGPLVTSTLVRKDAGIYIDFRQALLMLLGCKFLQ